MRRIRRHPWACPMDLITSHKIATLQRLGAGPSMTEERFAHIANDLHPQQPTSILLQLTHAVPRVETGNLVGLGKRGIVEGVLDEILHRTLQVQHRLADMH